MDIVFRNKFLNKCVEDSYYSLIVLHGRGRGELCKGRVIQHIVIAFSS